MSPRAKKRLAEKSASGIGNDAPAMSPTPPLSDKPILSIALEAVELGEKCGPEPFRCVNSAGPQAKLIEHAGTHYAALGRAYVEVVGALEEATDRCQLFLSTFGDVGDCVTQADINDWATALTKENTDG